MQEVTDSTPKAANTKVQLNFFRMPCSQSDLKLLLKIHTVAFKFNFLSIEIVENKVSYLIGKTVLSVQLKYLF